MAYDASKPNTSQTIGDVIAATNANDVALKLQQDTHEGNTTTAHGLAAVLTSKADYEAHKVDGTAHGINTTNASVASILAEIVASRGSKVDLAARLGVALQADGVIKLSSIASKWIDNGDIPTYVSNIQFTVPGDKTLVYLVGALLRLTVSGNYVYAPIASRSFGSGVTTINLDGAYTVLAVGLSKVEIALVAWDNAVASAAAQNASDIVDIQAQIDAITIPFRSNFIINGGCVIAQRTAPSLVLSTPTFGAVDRWACWATGTAVNAGTITQDTASSAGRTGYALKVSGATITGSGVVLARTRIESKDARGLKNKTASVSLIVHHDVGSAINYVITIRKANSADNFGGVTDIQASGNISVNSGTATLIAFQSVAMGDCSNGIEIEIKGTCGAVTTKNFSFTEMKIEEGSTATSFAPNPVEKDFAMCRRYYQEIGGLDANEVISTGQNKTTTTAGATLRLDTPMRIAPTPTVSAAADFAVWNSSGGLVACSALAAAVVTPVSLRLDITVASGLVAGDATVLQANNTANARLKLSAEL